MENVRVVDKENNGGMHFDPMTEALSTIEYAHYEVHGGDAYVVGISNVLTPTANIALAFKVPAGSKRVHMLGDWHSESKANLQVWEGRTWTGSTGAVVPLFNRNRNSIKTSILQGDQTGSWVANTAVKDPTGATGGTQVFAEYFYGDKKAGGTLRRSE